ncbi:MAG: PAS domain S-box protein [Hyphomicrobiales bacterium]|nr:PAS domain S-box protein [Hyphomicrobiales bacterium]MCP5373126.1 PAS domain S-box protein [Hyphomicrobiales bacterium]
MKPVVETRAVCRQLAENMRRGDRWVFALAVAAVLAILLIAIVAERLIGGETRRELRDTLLALVHAAEIDVELWSQPYKTAITAWADDREVRREVIELLATPRDRDHLMESFAQKRLRATLRPLLRGDGRHGFHVLAPDGTVLASSRPESVGGRDHLAQASDLAARLRGEGATFSPIRIADPSGRAAFAKATPETPGDEAEERPLVTDLTIAVRDFENRPVAILLLSIDPSKILSSIVVSGHLGLTGETYVIDNAGLLLTASRFDDGLRDAGRIGTHETSKSNLMVGQAGDSLAPASLAGEGDRTGGWRLTPAARGALAGEAGFDVDGYRDYRGVEVIGAWSWNTTLGVGIVSKIDLREAFSQLRLTRITIVVLTTLTVTVLAVLVVAFARNGRRLLRREGRLNAIISTAVDGIVTIRGDGTVEGFSPAAERIFGYAADEVVGRNVSMLMPQPYRDNHDRYLQAYLRTGEAKIIGLGRELTGLRKDGSTFPFELTVADSSMGTHVTFTGVVRDISSRKQTLTELAEKELKLRLAMDNMSDGIYTLDAEGRFHMFNERYLELVEAPADLVAVGMPILDLFLHSARHGYYGPGDPEEQARRRVASYLSPAPIETEITTISGRCLSVRKAPIEGGGAVVVVSDISASKRAQRELADAFAIISDSIEYASRIQRALLPHSRYLADGLDDHFVIWEPRDRVSGDMYWYRDCADGFLIAVADCTGHGVPGAFMSLIATGSLDCAMRERPDGDPAGVLAIINRSIKRYLDHNRTDNGNDDGLDVGVCRLRPAAGELVFSGAHFSLFVANGADVDVLKGDRANAGYRSVPVTQTYARQVRELDPEASYYLVTDGLLDQVGERTGRMFGKRRFKDLLAAIHHLPMAEQEARIRDHLRSYQGSQERRDDVTVLAFRAGRRSA